MQRSSEPDPTRGTCRRTCACTCRTILVNETADGEVLPRHQNSTNLRNLKRSDKTDVKNHDLMQEAGLNRPVTCNTKHQLGINHCLKELELNAEQCARGTKILQNYNDAFQGLQQTGRASRNLSPAHIRDSFCCGIGNVNTSANKGTVTATAACGVEKRGARVVQGCWRNTKIMLYTL